MAQIYSSDLSKEMQEAAKLQVSKDIIPNQLAEKVIPVMEVNPKLLKPVDKFLRATNAASTNTLMYTVPTGKRFYMTHADLSFSKDATATATQFWLQINYKGAVVYHLYLAALTLTAERAQISSDLVRPIVLDQGGTISLFCDAFNANQRMNATVLGYEVDNANS